jgi:predicted DNA-binding transcriptional regulator YafY
MSNARKAVCRPKEQRHSLLVRFLASRGERGATMQEIQDHLLQEMEEEFVTKTICRDIEHLRDSRGYTIEFVPSRQRWIYRGTPGSQPDSLLAERLSTNEMTALCQALAPMLQQAIHPFHADAVSALQKVGRMLPPDQRKEMEARTKKIGASTGAVVDVNRATIEVLIRAIKETLEVDVEYATRDDRRYKKRVVQPHELVLNDGKWYVLAADAPGGTVKSFFLNRGRNWRLSQRPFRRNPEFSLAAFMDGTFQMMRGTGPKQKIRLLFEPVAGKVASEQTVHPSQTVKQKAGGRVEIGFELNSLEQIRRWILRFEGEVKVLAPPELKQQVREAGKRIAAQS